MARHLILIAEDDPQNAEVLREAVESMDFEARVVTTLEEIRACLEALTPCAMLQDMQMPHAAGARPHEKAGESGIRMLRKKSNGARRVPVLVVTAFRSDPDFVWAMAELEADGFVEKANIGKLPDKLLAVLKKNGREDHANCARCNAESAGAAAAAVATAGPAAAATAVEAGDGGVRLVIDGVTNKRRSGFLVNGMRRELQDAKFVSFLRLVVAHQREPGSWSTKTALGWTRDRWIPSRIREAFKGAVPEGFEIVEGDGHARYRLNPAVVVESVDWKVLAGHAEVGVVKIAREEMGRG